MRRTLLSFIASVILITGCASKFMDEVSRDVFMTNPAPGKAMVYFIRNTSFGGLYHSHIYDGTDYIGTLFANTNMVYLADPGKHLFMVEDDETGRADFLEAELAEGKLYYTVVVPTGRAVQVIRAGRLLPPFVFRPQNGQIDQGDIEEAIRTTKQVTINSTGRVWGEQNKKRAEAVKDKYFPDWDHLSVLHAENGRDFTQVRPRP